MEPPGVIELLGCHHDDLDTHALEAEHAVGVYSARSAPIVNHMALKLDIDCRMDVVFGEKDVGVAG